MIRVTVETSASGHITPKDLHRHVIKRIAEFPDGKVAGTNRHERFRTLVEECAEDMSVFDFDIEPIWDDIDISMSDDDIAEYAQQSEVLATLLDPRPLNGLEQAALAQGKNLRFEKPEGFAQLTITGAA